MKCSNSFGMISKFFVWNNDKSFASFQGNELALYVAHIEIVNDFLHDKLADSEEIVNISESHVLWKDMFIFLGYTRIDDTDWYLQKIDEYISNAKAFYLIGSTTFLTSSNNVGDLETFYMHAMRFYTPQLAKTTFERHGLGIGIFNMQGFERRNKESKNTYRRFTNKKNNLTTQNMKRLYDVFHYSANSI